MRYAHFGEGRYEDKERVIRQLLAEPGLPAPVSGQVTDQTPTEPQTPETYLGYARLDRIVGTPVAADREATYALPEFLPEDSYGLAGRWTIEAERAIAGAGAQLRLHYRGDKAFLVLGSRTGDGIVRVKLDGVRTRTIRVTAHRLYELAASPGHSRYHLLELELSPGVEAYAFTFG